MEPVVYLLLCLGFWGDQAQVVRLVQQALLSLEPS